VKIRMSTFEREKREYFQKLYTEDTAKHYVRVHGWLEAARKRLAKIRSTERRKRHSAKYFTLPGEYAVDVLLLANNGIIQQTEVGFPRVVYCERDLQTVSVINKKLGRCMGVFSGTFERVVFTRDFQSYCPFDIINLDLTKEIFPLDGRPESNTIRAIEKLLWLHKNREFDFYLTFKSSRKETNPDAVREFERMVIDNFKNNKTWEETFVKNCGGGVKELLKSDFTLFWCKSFPKWILETGITNNVAGSLQGEYIYLRKPPYGAPYHIVTFLFSFARKSHGLMGKHKAVSECKEEIFRSFALTPFDVDKYLKENTAEKTKLKEDLARILKTPPKISKV